MICKSFITIVFLIIFRIYKLSFKVTDLRTCQMTNKHHCLRQCPISLCIYWLHEGIRTNNKMKEMGRLRVAFLRENYEDEDFIGITWLTTHPPNFQNPCDGNKVILQSTMN